MKASPVWDLPRGARSSFITHACDQHGDALLRLAMVVTGRSADAERAVAGAIADAWTQPSRTPAYDDPRLRHDLAKLTYWRCIRGGPDLGDGQRAVTPGSGLPEPGPGERVADSLRTLPVQERAAIALCLYGGHTYQETADLLALPAERVAGLLSLGLRRLSPHLPGTRPTGPDARLADVHALIAAEMRPKDAAGVVAWMARLCGAAARGLPVIGAGVTLTAEDGGRGVLAATGRASQRLEELQYTLGEGPSLDAFTARRPVLEPDLSSGSAARWPMFARAAQEEGIRAVFAFPLQMGAARLGTLDLYRTEPGSLSTQALSQAITFADVAMGALLDSQRVTVDAQPSEGLIDALDHRAELYQAQGMVMVQLGVDLKEAMVRLRGHAYASNCRLGDVAGEVVGRRLVLDSDIAPAAT